MKVNKKRLLVAFLLALLFSIPVSVSVADQAKIQEVTPITFDTVGSDYYDIRENKFDDLVSETGKLKLSFAGNASLEVRLGSHTASNLDTDHLKLHLTDWVDSKWIGLSQDWQEIASFEGSATTTDEYVSYELKYELNKVDTPAPNRYGIGLEFRLTQDEGSDYTISVRTGDPGPGKWVLLQIKNKSGSGIPGVRIEINGEFVGTTFYWGYKWVKFPEEGPVTVTARKGNREATRTFSY